MLLEKLSSQKLDKLAAAMKSNSKQPAPEEAHTRSHRKQLIALSMGEVEENHVYIRAMEKQSSICADERDEKLGRTGTSVVKEWVRKLGQSRKKPYGDKNLYYRKHYSS
jgi:hypothetical protein